MLLPQCLYLPISHHSWCVFTRMSVMFVIDYGQQPPPTTPLLPPPDAQNGNHEPVSLPPDFIIQTKPTSFGYHKSPTPPGLTMHARQHPPELPQSRSASQSHSSQTPRNLTPDHDSPAPRRPKPEDVPKIRKLSRELCDLRRHVTAAVTRETAILNELNALNSPPITESSVHIKSSDDESRNYFVVV